MKKFFGFLAILALALGLSAQGLTFASDSTVVATYGLDDSTLGLMVNPNASLTLPVGPVTLKVNADAAVNPQDLAAFTWSAYLKATFATGPLTVWARPVVSTDFAPSFAAAVVFSGIKYTTLTARYDLANFEGSLGTLTATAEFAF